ncbi:MAG: Crp/Fnr family transcriptional regulator [bacterium]|nr:Crp/Fnr family transcriptional regulator [bacterium]
MQKSSSFFDELDLGTMRDCLGTRRKTYSTGEHLFHEGERADHFGLVLSGAVNVVRYSLDGREKVLSHLTPGEVFGTSFILGGESQYFASIVATEPTTVLLLRGDKVLHPCSVRCPAHIQLLTHLLETIAHRNTLLARKIECLTQHTTAEKLLSYLALQAEDAGSAAFEIPFTRQQLADYLNVDRAALSTEIGKLVQAGRIETTRKWFRLLDPESHARA